MLWMGQIARTHSIYTQDIDRAVIYANILPLFRQPVNYLNSE